MLQIGELIRNKYTIEKELGLGRMSHTFLANDNENKKVVVKVIQLKGLPEWKILELFEREAQILKGISHPRIPKYIEYFKEEKDDNTIFYLIYEYIEGTSLSKVITTSYKLSYDDVKQILLQILDILDFLHSRFPPIIHRDINPNNIILDFNKNAYLVDFGASSLLMYGEKEGGGSTFVGTYGYIPIEQMRGNAVPQSDFYALGMTAINLLTGENPNNFQLKDLKPDYLGKNSPNDVDKAIDKMIEMDYKKRPKLAKEVIQLLTEENSKNTIQNRNTDNNQIIKKEKSFRTISEKSFSFMTSSSIVLQQNQDENKEIIQNNNSTKNQIVKNEAQKSFYKSASKNSLTMGIISFISSCLIMSPMAFLHPIFLALSIAFSLIGIKLGSTSLSKNILSGKSKTAGIFGIVLSALSSIINVLYILSILGFH